MFGIDDAIIAALISGAATAGTGIYNSYQNKKRLQEQQRATNMANIDQQNLALQQNLGTLANNRDYIDDRQNQIVLKTRNDNQLKYGGDDDKYAARDNTRTQFVPGTGYVPNAKLNKNTGKNVQYDSGPLGFVPVVGDILQGGQAISDFKNKNYKRAALNAGLLFLPNVIERLGKPVVKTVAKSVKGSKKVATETIPERYGSAMFDDYNDWVIGRKENLGDIIGGEKGQSLDELLERIEELNKQQKAVEYLTDIDSLPFKYGGSYKYHKHKRC